MCKELTGLQSCMLLGLNISTGVSPKIKISDVESIDGLLHTSNGARIIRDDVVPFNMFKILREYSTNGNLEAITFTGFRDTVYETNMIYDRIAKRNKKINTLNDKIKEDLKVLNSLSNKPRTQIYSHQDIIEFILNTK